MGNMHAGIMYDAINGTLPDNTRQIGLNLEIPAHNIPENWDKISPGPDQNKIQQNRAP